MRKFIQYKSDSYQTINFELYKGRDEFSLGLECQNDFERTISFNLSLPFLFKFYCSIDTDLCKTNWWKKLLFLNEDHQYEGREFRLSIFPDEVAWGKDYYIIFNFASYPHSSGGGFSFFKSLTDLIYGKFTYNKNIVEQHNKTVFIPGVAGYADGNYDLIITRKVSVWKWKRFNKTFSTTYFDVKCEKGVPHRFKYGEQDSVFSQSVEASNVNDAIEKFIDSIQKCRIRYS